WAAGVDVEAHHAGRRIRASMMARMIRLRAAYRGAECQRCQGPGSRQNRRAAMATQRAFAVRPCAIHVISSIAQPELRQHRALGERVEQEILPVVEVVDTER